jgi:hypothetical protein
MCYRIFFNFPKLNKKDFRTSKLQMCRLQHLLKVALDDRHLDEGVAATAFTELVGGDSGDEGKTILEIVQLVLDGTETSN